MATSMKSIAEAFLTFHRATLDSEFSKSRGLHDFNEQQLLLPIRFFLLGWFGKIEAETGARRPSAMTRAGRIDFLVGNTAVEVAVRPYSQTHHQRLHPTSNRTEMEKLMLHPDLSMLVLLDFAPTRVDWDVLVGYRNPPSLGSGNYNKSNFDVYYFHREVDGWENLRINPNR